MDVNPLQMFLHDAFEAERMEAVSRIQMLEANILEQLNRHCYVSPSPAPMTSNDVVLAFKHDGEECTQSMAKVESIRSGVMAKSVDYVVPDDDQEQQEQYARNKKSRNSHEVLDIDAEGQDERQELDSQRLGVVQSFHSLTDENKFVKLVKGHLEELQTFLKLKESYYRLKSCGCLPAHVKSAVQRILLSEVVSYSIVAVIMLDAFIMAIDADKFLQTMIARKEGGSICGHCDVDKLEWIRVADIVFASTFTAELFLRVLAEEMEFLLDGTASLWNAMDTLVVVFAWTEIAFSKSSGMPPLRLFRILRALKSFRLLRALRFFQLRLVLLSLFHSIVPLMWCCFTFTLILFVFSLLFVQLLGMSLYASLHGNADEMWIESPHSNVDDVWIQTLIPWFGSSPGAMVSLFALTTGGTDWYEAYDAFMQMDVIAGLLFVVYIVIVVLGVLNVIAAVFVEVAVSKARSDESLALEEEHHHRKEMAKALVEVFHKIDTDGSQAITFDEWVSFTSTDIGKDFLTLYKVEAEEAEHVFHLLDLDDSSEIPIQEFVVGFMHLQGAANRLEQHECEMEMRRQKHMLNRCNKTIQELSSHRTEDVERLEKLKENMETIMKQLPGSARVQSLVRSLESFVRQSSGDAKLPNYDRSSSNGSSARLERGTQSL